MLVALAGALNAAAQVPAQQPRYDLLLKGGHVIDPANHLDGIMDVAVSKDRIAAVEKSIPAAEAARTVDVSGLYVTPGLIDIHVHVGHGGAPLNWFAPEARAHTAPLGVPADTALESGVTTVVDAGSAGADTFAQEKEQVIDHAKVRVLAFLNIVADGMNGGLEQSLEQMDSKRCAETIRKYPDFLVGVKTAHYWTKDDWDAEHTPWAAVDRAEDCGRAANVPVMFDFWPRPERTYADLILKKMRPGDIHTHVFAQQFPIILPGGQLNPIMTQARSRGVIFDVGHGEGSFWFRNAVPAVKQGFVPDSTVNPAAEIRRSELGTLSPGNEADIAVLEELHGRFGYIDCGYARMTGDVRLAARMTIRDGRILYDPTGLSMVEWEKAPAQYFSTPALGSSPRAKADDYPRE
jgi:dihydroorotase